MSIRKHIEAADDALRLAIIEALEKKRDEQLETMFEALGKVRELILTTPIRVLIMFLVTIGTRQSMISN